MKQTLSLTPSTDALGLDPWFAGSPVVITGTVPAYPTMDTWKMQLWKYPHDAQVADAEPLATAVGAVVSTTVTITFSPSQMTYDALSLSDEAGANHYWLTLGGEDEDGFQQLIRAGTVEIMPCPFSGTAPTTATAITVTDDVATFSWNGSAYTLPVVEIESPDGAVEGEIIVIDDMAVLTVDGVSYTFPVQESA